ncbi:MAG: S8 family serine peptidase [Candidatus Zixiibacteriota bacterium]
MSNFGRWTILLIILSFSLAAAKQRPDFQDPSFFRAKDATPISDQAINYLAKNQVDGKVKIWVFFTDKNIFNQAQFKAAAQAAQSGFTERAKARRAKHGITEARFTDLPVNASYVSQLESLGAKILSASKWLNAAAVEIDLDRVGSVTRTSFVSRVQPTATFKRPVEEAALEKGNPSGDLNSLESHSLLYGGSLGQLTQINVPICHDSGYAGQGMIIAMLDTGFRKSHNSFAQAYLDGRVLAEHDFIYNDGNVSNEPIDQSDAWSHGTSTWSTSGGANPGVHYGPAYLASFILCKTEDVRSETIQEEYNWEAAIEWSDSIGTDIVSSSLGYTDWYVTANYNGDFCVTTIAADVAASVGILVVNSAGNAGSAPQTLGAPADADSIITVGAVSSTGTIVSFSSRGPTADGRIKPEVCAQGSGVSVASSAGDGVYGSSSGTSFSCPLTAGAAAIVWGANPTWTNMQVREALMTTASNNASPNNNYGWGIINTWEALNFSFDPPTFVPGDADATGIITISDAVFLINYIFSGGPTPIPTASGDADCNSIITITDAVYLINYIFGGGNPPALCP